MTFNKNSGHSDHNNQRTFISKVWQGTEGLTAITGRRSIQCYVLLFIMRVPLDFFYLILSRVRQRRQRRKPVLLPCEFVLRLGSFRVAAPLGLG